MNEQPIQRIVSLLKPNPGWCVLLSALGLTVIGLAAIGVVSPQLMALQAQRWVPVSLIIMLICTLPHPRTFGRFSYALLAIAIVLLLFLIAPGVPRAIVPVVNGARSWIDLRLFHVQPSEFAKIAFVLALGWYLRYRDSYRTLRGLLVPFVIMLIPMALILKEPDLGTALLFTPVLFAMLIAAGAKLRHLFSLIAIGVLVVGVNVAIIAFHAPQWMHLLEQHQEVRIASMIWPQKYALTAGYQQDVSLRMIAAGGLDGYGRQRASTVLHFNKLPYDENDMIFAVVVSAWGLIGALVVIALYMTLFISCLWVASKSRDPFSRLVCVGLTAMIFTEAVLNISVATGLAPTTGITLPFISYGGSSIASSFAMVGLVLNIASRRPAILSRPSFEFDTPQQAKA